MFWSCLVKSFGYCFNCAKKYGILQLLSKRLIVVMTIICETGHEIKLSSQSTSDLNKAFAGNIFLASLFWKHILQNQWNDESRIYIVFFLIPLISKLKNTIPFAAVNFFISSITKAFWKVSKMRNMERIP